MRDMIIDFHAHAFSDDLAPRARVSLETGSGIAWSFDGTVGGMLAQMDAAGIDRAVLQPVATRAASVPRVNDWAASLTGDRIVSFGAMHPEVPDPVAEVRRMASLGLAGFKLHPEFQGFEPDDPALAPIFSAARDEGLVVLFHAGADPAYTSIRGNPQAFARMLDAYPGLKVVLAHMGGFRCWDGVRESLVGRDVWLDTAYTLPHLPAEEFVDLVRAHGADRVLFGTDGPWTDPAHELSLIRDSGLSPQELEAITGTNALRLVPALACR